MSYLTDWTLRSILVFGFVFGASIGNETPTTPNTEEAEVVQAYKIEKDGPLVEDLPLINAEIQKEMTKLLEEQREIEELKAEIERLKATFKKVAPIGGAPNCADMPTIVPVLPGCNEHCNDSLSPIDKGTVLAPGSCGNRVLRPQSKLWLQEGRESLYSDLLTNRNELGLTNEQLSLIETLKD